MTLLEVICTTIEEAQIAEANGVDRIELIRDLSAGGLTPSYPTIDQIVREIQIPVYVMVRPHSKSFCYSKQDVENMLKDIRKIKQIGAAGIVVGALTEDHEINLPVLEILLAEAEGLGVTFHRAFDETNDPFRALEQLLELPTIERILTSGGRSNVLHAIPQIKQLVHLTKNTPLSILAGAGLTLPSLHLFVEQTCVEEVHFGKGVRIDVQPNNPLDPQIIKNIKMILA
jgi:copper homeostasis protein